VALSDAYNLLALSDVHLGSDLVYHVRPDAPRRTATSDRRDRDLVALLDYYRLTRVDDRPWRLVIGGDFIDFTGMSVMPCSDVHGGVIVTEPTEEELAHGLGGAEDHTLAKLRLVMAHHAEVMQALSAFVAAGNELVIVPGNHDVDWHWDSAQAEFKQALTAGGAVDESRITFAPWFYYEEGLIYLEHGHQYDSYCSHDHVLYPVSPNDPRRSTRSLSDILLRYVVRPTRGMTEGGHDAMSWHDYLRFAVSLGVGGLLMLARRFFNANRALFALWREHVSEAAAWARGEHERRIDRFNGVRAIGLERLKKLVHLQRPPLTRSIGALMSGVMLDRVLMALLAGLAMAAAFTVFDHWAAAGGVGLAVALVLAVLRRAWFRRHAVDPSAMLREGSAGVARLFPAAFVVMGHTHLPEVRPASAEATYVNLGAWAEEEVSEGRPALPATRTHLVLTHGGSSPVARLMQWRDAGPHPFDAK
jgi:UDP-2,3-diacylglucosamine pyrophosphatase LpxH